MKTNTKTYVVASLVFITLCLTTKMEAVPLPVNPAPVWSELSLKDLDKKTLERKLGRKLLWKEKVALRYAKRKMRQQQKALARGSVKLWLKGGKSIKGNICDISNDSIYFKPYDKRKSASANEAAKVIAFPASKVLQVRLYKLRAKGKKRKKKLLIFSLLFLTSGIMYLAGYSKIAEHDGIPPTVFIGLFGMAIFGILALINVFGIIRKKTYMQIGDHIPMAKLEVLQEYLMNNCL